MEVPETTSENNQAEIGANLRFAPEATHLVPKCPVWMSFVNESPQSEYDSSQLGQLKTPDEILVKSTLNGLGDCQSAIFSNSSPEPWLVHVTRDYPTNQNSEATWINHFVEIVGQWNPESVGFAFPTGLISKDFILADNQGNQLQNRFNHLLIKVIYTLTHASSVRHFYIYAGNQDQILVLNYLFNLKKQLQKAKVLSFVFH